MRNLSGNKEAPNRPWDRRSAAAGGARGSRSHPRQSEMFVRVGAIIAAGLCVGVALDFVVAALTH